MYFKMTNADKIGTTKDNEFSLATPEYLVCEQMKVGNSDHVQRSRTS